MAHWRQGENRANCQMIVWLTQIATYSPRPCCLWRTGGSSLPPGSNWWKRSLKTSIQSVYSIRMTWSRLRAKQPPSHHPIQQRICSRQAANRNLLHFKSSHNLASGASPSSRCSEPLILLSPVEPFLSTQKMELSDLFHWTDRLFHHPNHTSISVSLDGKNNRWLRLFHSRHTNAFGSLF
jgi:hypothetical protein